MADKYVEQDVHLTTCGRISLRLYCGGSFPPEIEVIEKYEQGGSGGLLLTTVQINEESAVSSFVKEFTKQVLPIIADGYDGSEKARDSMRQLAESVGRPLLMG